MSINASGIKSIARIFSKTKETIGTTAKSVSGAAGSEHIPSILAMAAAGAISNWQARRSEERVHEDTGRRW